MVDEVVTEPPKDAETAAIDARFVLRGHLDHSSTGKGVELELAAAPAEGAGRLRSRQLPGPPFDRAEALRQGPHRAHCEALAAGDAVVLALREDMGREAPFRDLEHIRSRDIDAGLDAAEAHDAPVEPLPDQRGPVFDPRRLSFLREEFVVGDTEF